MSLPITAEFPQNARNRSEIPPPVPLHELVPEDIYWRDYYDNADVSYEWNNGYLEIKPVSDYQTYLMYKWFFNLLCWYLDIHPIASTTGLEMGFKLRFAKNDQTIRKPDLGVVLNDNPVPILPADQSYRGVCDLCVEALSTSTKAERERDTVIKKSEYARIGVKEYFILHHSHERAFYRRNVRGLYVPIRPTKDGVIQSQVLPGFQFRIEDLLEQPAIKQMIVDPIYRSFVFPAWQAAEQRAQEAEQRAAALQAEIDKLKALLEK